MVSGYLISFHQAPRANSTQINADGTISTGTI